jgi:hypothetical protein
LTLSWATQRPPATLEPADQLPSPAAGKAPLKWVERCPVYVELTPSPTPTIAHAAMMDQHRGRSPSTGQRNNIRHTPSPSPHAFHNTLGIDPSLSSHDPAYANSFTSSSQAFDPQYLATTQSHQFSPPTALDPGFLQATQSLSHHSSPHFAPQGSNTLAPDPLDLTSSNPPDFNNFFAGNDIIQDQAGHPSYIGSTLDPQLLDTQPHQNASVNPSELMNQMAATQSHPPTPPHLLPSMHNRQTPSPHASPNMNAGAFPSPGHSRHASLDPSAAYGQPPGTEWGNMANFRGHRRAPSETYSDVSSAHASPYLVQHDSFEDNQPSPMLNPQADPQLFHDPVMQFGQFTIADNSHISPGHSPHISPRLMPAQQALPQFQPGTFGLDPHLHDQYAQQGMGAYPTQGSEPFPTINQGGPEFGQADPMSPPEINIDFAPPSRQASFEPPKPDHQMDALSPPDRCK